MQINTLKLKNPRKRRKFVGRGGKKGTYSGRGNKGQKARTGAKVNPLFEGGRSTLIDHMKKKRGFKSLNLKPLIIHLSRLDKAFKDGDLISRESLIKAGLIDKIKSAKVKILGGAKTKKKFKIEKGILFSASAKKAIKEVMKEAELKKEIVKK